MPKQGFPAKAKKRGNAGHLAALARGENPNEKKTQRKHGGIGTGNAFENLTYRSKHEVLQLGKPRGKVKRPAASQSHALAQRQQALLAEIGARDKANSFTDERIAETSDNVDLEDKLLMRLQKERQQRMSKFSMADDEDTLQLTHLGQALSTEPRRRFDKEEQEGEEEEDFNERKEGHTADGDDATMEGEEGAPGSGVKSRHEVMSEVMLKSKMFRAERQVKASEQEDLHGQLDAEFDDIRNSLSFVTQRERDDAKKAAREAEKVAQAAARAAAKAAAASGESTDAMEVDPADLMDPTDEYVMEARQLGLDIRAKATDRLKTDEELIAAEKKRLERLEKLRLKRSRGETDLAEEDAANEEEETEGGYKRRRREQKAERKKAIRPVTDDDLETNFVLTGAGQGPAKDEHDLLSEDEEGDHAGNKDDDDEDDEDEEEDDEEDGEDDSEDDSEDENDGAIGSDLEEEEEQPKAVFIGSTPAAKSTTSGGAKEIFIGKDGKSSVSAALLAITAKLAGKADGATAAGASASTAAAKQPASNSDENLPFTFPAPATYKEFRTLLASYPSAQHSVIIHRIKTVNHISLAPANKAKMEKFYAILLTHFRRLATEFEKLPHAEQTEASVAKLLARMDEIARHIVELTELPSMNAVVGRAFRAQLLKIREEIDAPDATIKADQLLFFKLISNIFPTSDFRHNVVTPSLLLMAEMINRVAVVGPADVTRGFFLISTLLHAINASKRFVPEILTFLHATLLHGCGIQRSAEEKVPKSTPAASKAAPSTAITPSSEFFSVTPSAARLHASLQPRQMNFLPSPSLALWSAMLAPSKNKKPTADADEPLHIPLHWLFFANGATVFTTSRARIATFSTQLQLVHQCAQLWHAHLASYPELFTPLMDAIGRIMAQQTSGAFAQLPHVLQTYTTHLHAYLSGSIQHAISLRVPLAASLAPLALKQHNPLFVEGYNPTKDYDPIKERAANKELAQKLKREKKGALRELRRDTAVVQQQQRALADAYAAERESKRKQAWAQMEEQQRDTNLLAKASKKKERKEQDKKRGGSKKK